MPVGGFWSSSNRGALDLTPLLTHRFPLERAMEAYALFEAKAEGVLKIALEPPQIQ